MPKPQYGSEHQRRRARLVLKAYGQLCQGCGKPMLRGQELDAAHSQDVAVNPKAKADHMRHAGCNRSDGGKLGNARRQFRPSRIW